ncbi:MAG: hypothetical protein P4L03_07395 [Terracidiphilus sp.]|nr:hypothetical protein [Terracidiphilus sp.]
MRWRNILDFLGWPHPPQRDEVKEIEPRPLSEREFGWVREILACNSDWRSADCSETRVVAEGPNCGGYSIYLKAPNPESSTSESTSEMVGQLWIETKNRLTINIQLSQWQGRLREIYYFAIDRKGRNRDLPDTWEELSRQAVNF